MHSTPLALSLSLVFMVIVGCNPAHDTVPSDHSPPVRTAFAKNDLVDTIAWLKERQHAVGVEVENPANYDAAKKKLWKELEAINGTEIQWSFKIDELGKTFIGSNYYATVKARTEGAIRINFKEFSGAKPNLDLYVPEDVTLDTYRTWKVGTLITVRGTVHFNDETYIAISVRGAKLR